MESFNNPRLVGESSVVAIVAPAGPFNRNAFERGVTWLRKRYEVRYDESIFDSTGYFAGTDDRRLAELKNAINDSEVDAILCARGGYGATRLLPGLDPEEVRQANKVLAGFSDVTALHALWARAGVRSVHAPMVAALGKMGDKLQAEWVRTLEGREQPESWELSPVVGGKAEGRLFGGNLAVLCALLGTPYEPPIDGVILFLEDVGERPYRIDRMLTSLTQAGWFERCAGVVLGAFTEGQPGPDGIQVQDVLEERFGRLEKPVLAGFPAGHIDRNEPMTFGATASIDGRTFTITA